MAGEGKFALNIDAVYVFKDGTPVPLLDYLAQMDGGEAPTWGDLTGKPGTFPPAAHEHALEDVSGLASALAGKQATGDYATASTVSSVTSRVAALEDADLVPRSDLETLAARVAALESTDPEEEIP